MEGFGKVLGLELGVEIGNDLSTRTQPRRKQQPEESKSQKLKLRNE